MDEQGNRTLGNALVNVSCVRPLKSEEVLFTTPIVRGFPAEVFLDGLPAFGTTDSNDPTSLAGYLHWLAESYVHGAGCLDRDRIIAWLASG